MITFEFVLVVLWIVMGVVVVRTVLYVRSKSAREIEKLNLTAKRLERTVDERLSKIESRLANIETPLELEVEKAKKFDAL